MTDKTHISISIPYDLARLAIWQRKTIDKYQTNEFIKAIDTWLILKHETTSGYIQEWNKQKEWLLKICKCSESIFRSRLKYLQKLKLVTFNRHGITVCSWETIGKSLNIDTSNCLEIKYAIDDKQRVCEWIIAAEIQDNKQRQEFALIKKLNENPGVRKVITNEIIAAGADSKQITDLNYFLSWMRVLYYNDFMRASNIHSTLIEFRPDNNRGVRKIADVWKARHAVTVSYWKKVLKQKKILDIVPFQIQSDNRVRNKYCKVLWLKKEKQTLLCLCDQIELLKPWTLTEPKFFTA